jgi:hypothetical protein
MVFNCSMMMPTLKDWAEILMLLPVMTLFAVLLLARAGFISG